MYTQQHSTGLTVNGKMKSEEKKSFSSLDDRSHVARVFFSVVVVVLFAQTTRNRLNLVNEISREEALLTTNERNECE